MVSLHRNVSVGTSSSACCARPPLRAALLAVTPPPPPALLCCCERGERWYEGEEETAAETSKTSPLPPSQERRGSLAAPRGALRSVVAGGAVANVGGISGMPVVDENAKESPTRAAAAAEAEVRWVLWRPPWWGPTQREKFGTKSESPAPSPPPKPLPLLLLLLNRAPTTARPPSGPPLP